MRRRIAASAVAVATLIVGLPLSASAASASAPAHVSAEDVFYPDGQAPVPAGDKPAAEPDPAPQPAATDSGDREAALMRGDRQAADRLGWMPSLYEGKWFMPKKESIRRCIMDRESNFNYRAVGAGTYFGAYQMNRGLAVSATYTMEKEVENEMGAEGVALVKALRKTPPNTWNRYWQDRAFWTIWNNGKGKNHWRGGHHNCF